MSASDQLAEIEKHLADDFAKHSPAMIAVLTALRDALANVTGPAEPLHMTATDGGPNPDYKEPPAHE